MVKFINELFSLIKCIAAVLILSAICRFITEYFWPFISQPDPSSGELMVILAVTLCGGFLLIYGAGRFLYWLLEQRLRER